jgi:hypothetical protein
MNASNAGSPNLSDILLKNTQHSTITEDKMSIVVKLITPFYLIIKIALWVSSTQSAFACVNIITYSPLCCQLFAHILRKFYITP